MLRVAVVVGLFALVPSTSFAQSPRTLHLTMPGGPVTDAVVLGASAAMMVTGTFVLSPPSDSQLAPLDGRGHHTRDTTFGRISDGVLIGGLVGAAGAGFFIEHHRGARGWDVVRVPLVLTEAVGLTLGVVSLVKNVGGVCRPRAWDDATSTCLATSEDDRRSFPSGHTAPLAALAGASLGMWLFPSHRAPPGLVALFGATLVLAASNLTLRVMAGAHSWVDTATGFGLGFGIGLATAALHVRAGGWTVSPMGSSGLQVGRSW